MAANTNSFATRSELASPVGPVTYYSLQKLADAGFGGIDRLPFSIRILLENLLRNAAEAVPDGGRARVEVRHHGVSVSDLDHRIVSARELTTACRPDDAAEMLESSGLNGGDMDQIIQ